MIALDAIQLRTIAADVLRLLQVDDSVAVLDVHDLSDGAWSVSFEDRWPDTRFPTFAIEIQQDWSRDGAARELRTVLREKLWICPLCQRRAVIRRLVDMSVFRIECHRCGRFEIENEVLDLFRSAHEDGDEPILSTLPRLSGFIRSAASPPSLGVDTWKGLAGDEPRRVEHSGGPRVPLGDRTTGWTTVSGTRWRALARRSRRAAVAF